MITRISKTNPSTSILSTSILQPLHTILLCHIIILLHLPLLASSQPPINPSSQNCYAAPCTYLGECRDYSGVCGDTVAYCNVESTWVPACGGGAGLEKPRPVGGSVVVVATSTATAASNNVNGNGNGGGSGGGGVPPTVSPTTAWEKWISQKNNDPPANVDNEQNNQPDNNNNASPSNNNNKANQNENDNDNTNYVPNNQTGTFDANTWGYYGEEEEEGMLDKMKFWQGDDEDGESNAACPSAMESSRTEVVFLVCLGVAWAILL